MTHCSLVVKLQVAYSDQLCGPHLMQQRAPMLVTGAAVTALHTALDAKVLRMAVRTLNVHCLQASAASLQCSVRPCPSMCTPHLLSMPLAGSVGFSDL